MAEANNNMPDISREHCIHMNKDLIDSRKMLADNRKQLHLNAITLSELKNRMDKNDRNDLFGKFAIAIQDINVIYHLNKSLDSTFNSKKYKRKMLELQGNYIFEEDSEVIIYDKTQLLRTELLKLKNNDISSFDKIYGNGIVKEMLSHLDKILQSPRPLDCIVQEPKYYIYWFDI